MSNQNDQVVQCKYCKKLFAKSVTGATTEHAHHIDNCLQKELSLGEETQKKQVISFIGCFWEGFYHKLYIWSCLSKRISSSYGFCARVFILYDELCHFHKFMKVYSPFYEKINRHNVKKDCVTYTIEKKMLKSILKDCSKLV